MKPFAIERSSQFRPAPPPKTTTDFAVLPQILPRVVDVTLYRWEHNVRAATVMGVIGAGGIGLEIMTAFQLFEYREALALILLLLVLVTAINFISKRTRKRFLHAE
ncbi:MAG: hypothetical protein AABO58_06025 [Acidobacteriota bacterium]